MPAMSTYLACRNLCRVPTIASSLAAVGARAATRTSGSDAGRIFLAGTLRQTALSHDMTPPRGRWSWPSEKAVQASWAVARVQGKPWLADEDERWLWVGNIAGWCGREQGQASSTMVEEMGAAVPKTSPPWEGRVGPREKAN